MDLAALGGATGLEGDVTLNESMFCGEIGAAMDADTAVLGFVGDPFFGDMVFQHGNDFFIRMAATAGEGANTAGLTSGGGGYLTFAIIMVGKDWFFAFAAYTAVTAF